MRRASLKIESNELFSSKISKIVQSYKTGEPIDLAKIEGELADAGIISIGLRMMNRKQDYFIRVKNKFGRTPKRRFFEAGNKAGKTEIGIMEDIAHGMGFRPWLKADDPDYKIPIKVPNRGLIGCETMEESVPGKIEPTLRALIPAYCTLPEDWKNNTQGKLSSVTLRYDYFGKPCGSTIHIRSYNQKASTFEGIDYDWEHWDEPPDEDVLMAAERGKVASNAPSWFTMTPISGAYLHARFSIKAFNAGGDDQEIALIRASAWENCQDWCRDCNVSIPENDPINIEPGKLRPINSCPQCGRVMGFVSKAGLEEYFKTLPLEMREAREEGKPLFLSGLVYKELDRDKHVYKDFSILKSWMKVEVVDPHDARATRWLFGAVAPEDIIINSNPANRIYWYGYLLANGDIEDIVRQVRVKRAIHAYSEPDHVTLDAKFGAKSIKTREGETTWEDELYKAGIKNIRLSHSAPGDIAVGHKRVKEYLKPHYSKIQGKEFPGMLFAEEGCAGERGPIQDMWNYQWKPGTSTPEEDFKDFCDCVRYEALEQPVYHEPPKEIDPKVMQFLLQEKMEKADEKYNPLSFGLKIS